MLGWHPALTEYEIKAVSAGEDAQGQVLVRCRRSSDEGPGALVVTGHGLIARTSSRRRSRRISWRSTSSTAPRSTASRWRSWRRASKRACRDRRHVPGGHDPGRRRRAGGRRRRPGACSTLPANGSTSRSTGPSTSSAASPSTRTAWPSATRIVEACRAADAILLGAVGGPKWDDPNAPVRPEQALFALRGGLGLFANLRPVTIHPALVPSSPLRPELLDGVDLLIVRELTGGIYFGAREEAVRRHRGALRPRHAARTRRQRSGASSGWRSSWPASRRGSVTSVDKANVLATSRLWRLVANEVARDFPDVALDAPARRLLRDAARRSPRPGST